MSLLRRSSFVALPVVLVLAGCGSGIVGSSGVSRYELTEVDGQSPPQEITTTNGFSFGELRGAYLEVSEDGLFRFELDLEKYVHRWWEGSWSEVGGKLRTDWFSRGHSNGREGGWFDWAPVDGWDVIEATLEKIPFSDSNPLTLRMVRQN
jgi:hypothetical protein